jgi:hypothetical protein
MTALTRTRLYVMVSLLLSASAAWGQFNDHIHGDAVSCKDIPYDKRGTVEFGYHIHGNVTARACGVNGAATSKSYANVGPPRTFGTVTTTTAKGGDLADTSSLSTDTAVLTPPSGWTGGPVPVKLKTSFTFSIEGATSVTPGTWALEWYIDSELKKEEDSFSNGNGKLNVAFPFDVEPDTRGDYYFLVQVTADTDAIAGPTGAPSVSIHTDSIDFELPQGWTCQWQSNGVSCDAP